MKMKKRLVYPLGVAVTILIAFAGAVTAGQDPDSVIVKNEVVLKKGPDTYMEVRHIVLKGSNEEIGKALADIAQKEYKTRLIKYADPVYAKARRNYMKLNYPVMLERMKGVARSYGISLENTDQDTSSLFYWMTAPQCSALFVPAPVSTTDHNFYVSNRDYYLASMSEIMDGKRKPGEGDFSCNVFVIELYPDQGYPSIGIGILDLLSINIDTINSKGLSVAVLADDTYGTDHTIHDMSHQSGLYLYQMVRLITDTCATLEDAKEAVLNNKMSMAILPAHFMVMDSSGRSFIYEKSSGDFSDRFVESDGTKVVPVTNHSISDYPTVDKFPPPDKNSYDTFNRYRVLEKYIEGHTGKYSVEDGVHAMSLVYGRVEEASEGGHHDLPLRTLYTAVTDINERAVSVRFYLRDGKTDPATGLPELIFSEPFEFRLK